MTVRSSSSQSFHNRDRLPANETAIFLSPLTSALATIWRRLHWLVGGLFLLYGLSGITFIEASQVGVVLRFGAVTKNGDIPTVHPPGFLWTLPRPFDQVLKIDVDRVDTLVIDELAPPGWRDKRSEDGDPSGLAPSTLDPAENGYILTADRHVLHAPVIVRYRIRDALAYSLWTHDGAGFLRSTLLESSIKTAGATRLDELLGGGRDRFARNVARDAQRRLDRIGAGLEIVSIEYEKLFPPEQVAEDFDAVQSAFIEAQTQTRDAHAYAVAVVPAARARAHETVARAEARSMALTSKARGEAMAFASLLPLYRENPLPVRQRIYRETIERSLGNVSQLRFVPAPVTDNYQGTRFQVSLRDATPVEGRMPRAPVSSGVDNEQPPGPIPLLQEGGGP